MKTFAKKERSPCSASDDSPPQRPKRNTCQKNFGVSNGLLWREETDLKRALYASLQETRKKNWEEDGEENLDEVEKTAVEMPESENSQEESPKKAKVHAQRKFAQCSTPNSPVPTPMKVPYVNNSTTELLPYRRPKTEDFLTFLCLRGTSILPPSLDFLNSCSKSDTSSECRSLSPELELKEYSSVKEANSVKNTEVKEKNNSKNENGDSAAHRKHSACKASSRRHSDTLQSVKRLHSVTSKLNKEIPALKKKKKKVKNVTQSVPYNISSSRLKVSSNTRTRSNTALHILREKYKKQRLASDKKKLLPAKNASTPVSSNSKEKGLTTRSQSIQKQGKEHTAVKVVTRNQIKLCHSSLSKIKKIKVDRKLAVEKRKSLRSANPSRDIIHKRFSPVNKKTPWLRRAKLVPPIVDVESDSEPEIIIASPVKKVPVPTVSQKPENISEETHHFSERLRNKRDAAKVQPRLTSRQMLLRKHMQSRLKAKKSLLRTKNVRSKVIVKRTAKQTILKKVRKNLVMKTMSLRKDLQNKRVTRSAKHQIQEMFWSNPEKRTKLQNLKQIQVTKTEKKHVLHESHPVSKKKKIIPAVKEKESASAVKEKESTLVAKEKESTKLAKCRVKESVKRKAQSVTTDIKTPPVTTEITRALKQNGTAKLTPKLKDNVKYTRSSKSFSSISNKSHASVSMKAIPVLPKTKTENTSSQIKISKSDPGKSEENRKKDLAVQGVSKVTNFSNVKLGNNNTKNNFSENEEKSKVISDKDSKIGKKINVPTNTKNELVNGIEDKKEANVQNNLNLLNPEKNNNKDISKLIGLNVECEETSFNVNFDPCCSGFPRNIKEERLNFENTSKEDNVKSEFKMNKKHSDKKSKKIVKEDVKPSRRETEKHSKLSKRNLEKSGIKAHRKDPDKGKENKDLSEINKDVRKITDKVHKKESTKCRAENIKDQLENTEEGKQAIVLNSKKNLGKEKIENSATFPDICKEKRIGDEMHKKDLNKDKTEIGRPESENDGKISKTSSRRDNLPQKPAKSEVRKESYESNSSGKTIEKGNSKDINREKIENTKHSDKKAKPNSNVLPTTVVSHDTESDEDSDYDITLDQFLKLKSEANSTSKSESLSVAAGASKTELNNEDKTIFSENKNVKYAKRDFDKDSQKVKKEGDSSKHKKEKDTSKNKSHDKESKTLKKEEKISKKDAEKSLAKLLKKEREREKSKSSKKEDKYKHKKDGSGSSKLSKKEYEKDGSKLSKKEPEKETLLEKQGDINELSEGKKDKASKKDSSKLSRSNSYEETKSPKKKKKHNEFKDIEKIKNLISKSSILNEFSGFKEFKRRSSSDKSELKKHLSKSKKRKKLALLKQKKLSKKLSAKLLRKYSKKKGLKSKKNKLKKKELKKEIKLTGLNNKIHSKSKKQKHKTKGDHHRRDSQDKIKNVELSASILTSTNSVSESSQYISKTPNDSECHINSDTKVLNNNVQTCTNDVSSASTYVIENVPESISSIETISAEAPQPISADLVFGASEEIPGIMTSEFTGVFDETFPPGAILLTTRDSISQVPLHFIQDLSIPKTMADAATNTGEDDIDESMSLISEPLKSEEMSVGTQTITPAGSPSPTMEVKPLIQAQSTESPVEDKAKSDISEKEMSDLVATAEKIQEKEPVIVIPSPSKSKAPNPSLPSKNPLLPKVKKRSYVLKKFKSMTNASLPKLESFPLDTPKLVAAPVYYPTIEEFRDPLEYICKIHEEAGKYGICKIVPPPSFKPECKVNDDMRFTAHNQYVHKMLYRWGPNVQHTACLKKHLKSQKVKLEQAPLIGGIELDVSKFYHTVQMFGGLQQVIEKKKWQRVADGMRVPKTAQDRVTKLYDAYCKYLVSYDTLPPEEKQKIEEEVISDHERRMKLSSASKDTEKEDEDLDDDENNDCVTKGRSMSLSNFFRIARNTMSMWFKNDPSPEEVEHEFWRLVTERNHHIVVHAGNIDSSVYQSGFPCNRNSPFAKHPWNLKILTNNSNSILRSMGPVSGITIPTLHVGMLFTTGCWYRDPHSLPWIEYLHTGASKIWYGIPANACEKFRHAMKKIMPEYCTNNPIWLPSDTAMVPPDLLVKHGASLSRTIQNSGQFVVIFPESFTSTICCGYCVSESVYFAPTPWLDIAVKAFQDIQNSCEPPAFSLERLLFSIGNDPKTQLETLQKIIPMIKEIRHQEMSLRLQLSDLGLKQFERLPLLEIRDKKRKFRGIEDESEQECEICRTHCYVSMVLYTQEDSIYCLSHALECIPKKNLKSCKLMYTYNENDFNELVKRIDELIAEQLSKQCARKKSPKKKLLAVPDK